MPFDFELPARLPVMTLRETVFFPQSILPLHIFEERYRRMLDDVLLSNRLFAVACRRLGNDGADEEEFPCAMATVGVVRASHANADGTSNLVLQGLCRVRVLNFTTEAPYPMIEIEEPSAADPGDPLAIARWRDEIDQLLQAEDSLHNGVPDEFMEFLHSLEDPEAFIDLTAFATCQCARTKQRLLETLPLGDRYQVFLHYLGAQCRRLDLQRRLQGPIEEGDIALN